MLLRLFLLCLQKWRLSVQASLLTLLCRKTIAAESYFSLTSMTMQVLPCPSTQ
jgi:hypothetical protein